MTLEDTASVLSSWLKTRHIRVLPEWTEACVDWIQNEYQGQNLSIDRLKELVYEQWLDSDLTEIATPSLPDGLAQTEKRGFQGAFALQINSIQDVGCPAYSQLIKIKGKENENVSVTATQATQSKFEPKPTRLLMMEVTDGHQVLQAMEYQPIGALNTDTPPGTKILVHGDIVCRLGVLTLTRNHVTVLGGEVEALMEENSQDKLLARIIGTSLDDIPGGTTQPRQPQTAPNTQGRDANHTESTRQQPPVVTMEIQPAVQGGSSVRPRPESKPDDVVYEIMDDDDDDLAGIDEELLRELEEAECSRPPAKTGDTHIKQTLPPEWPSDEDTDEEMLAAMIDNLEEQIKARGDSNNQKKSLTRQPSRSSSQASRKLSSTNRKRPESSMKQVPINSFMRPKPSISQVADKQLPSTDCTSSKDTDHKRTKNRLSLKSSMSQFSAGPKQTSATGKTNSSFIKAAVAEAPVIKAPEPELSKGGFVKAQMSSFAPSVPAKNAELNNDPSLSRNSLLNSNPNVGNETTLKSNPTRISNPALNSNQMLNSNSSLNRIPQFQSKPAQSRNSALIIKNPPISKNPPLIDSLALNGNLAQKDNLAAKSIPAQGVFVKAERAAIHATTSGKSDKLFDQSSSAGVSAAVVRPFVPAASQHPKVAVATRFTKGEEQNKLSLKRRRNSSSTSNIGPVAPFRYLSEVMDTIENPTEPFTFDIRGFIMTLLSSLCKDGNQWSLKVKLNDGSASLDAILGNQVLEELIGFSVSEMKQMRAAVKSQDEKTAVESVQKSALDQCRRRLVDLCEVMTVQVIPGEIPTVARIRTVEQQDIEQMKKCL